MNNQKKKKKKKKKKKNFLFHTSANLPTSLSVLKFFVSNTGYTWQINVFDWTLKHIFLQKFMIILHDNLKHLLIL